MKPISTILCAGLVPAFLSGTAGAVEVSYTAPVSKAPVEASKNVAVIDGEVGKLKEAVSSPDVSSQDLRAKAETLFEGLTLRESSDVGGMDLRGWEKPDQKTTDDVQGMLDATEQTLIISMATKAPPAPDLVEAHQYGKGMNADGKMAYDAAGRLNGDTLGAYEYSRDSAIGIYFNKAFKTIQRTLGDAFAAATAVHEAAHARDHAKGELNPVEVRKGEELAFKTEYLWLRTMDPSGQRLAWARYNYCGEDGSKTGVVCDYLKHLADIQDFGSRDDFGGLVKKLGYQDRERDPFEAPETKGS